MFFLNKLSFLVDSSHKQGNSLPHILLKTDDFSLARHFANEAAEMMNSQMICIDDGLDINKIGDFAGVLTNLNFRRISDFP